MVEHPSFQLLRNYEIMDTVNASMVRKTFG